MQSPMKTASLSQSVVAAKCRFQRTAQHGQQYQTAHSAQAASTQSPMETTSLSQSVVTAQWRGQLVINSTIPAVYAAGGIKGGVVLMNEFLIIFLSIKDFAERILKVIQKISLSLGIENETEVKEENFTAEINNNRISYKHKIKHTKLKINFSIGFNINADKNNNELFIYINSIDMILNFTYLLPTPSCSGKEQCDENGEIRYNAIESINEKYFSETTSAEEKDKIIEQILTEVAEELNKQCS
jgi:hypothetical protein